MIQRGRIAATVLVCIVILLAVLQLRAWNGAINSDGISYLELAAQYARGDLSAMANGYWSPLYPLLLGAAMRVSGVPATFVADQVGTPELRTAMALNLAILVLSTVLFVRLLAHLDESEKTEAPRVVRIARLIAGGMLWVWWTARLSGVAIVTPDLLLSAWLALLSTDLIAASFRTPSRSRAARIGVVLALGYYTKAVFFPLIPIVAAAYAWLLPRSERRSHLAVVLLIAAALTAPLVAVQSKSAGHFSFGETGRLNYRWYVNDAPRGGPIVEPPATSRARTAGSAMIQLDAAPATMLYFGQAGSSFPYWHDPSKFEPVRAARFSMSAQMTTVRVNLHWFWIVAGAFAVLCVVASAAAMRRERIAAARVVAALPALTLLALYALTHPEGRLAGSAIVCALVIALFPGGSSSRGAQPRRRGWLITEVVALSAIVALVCLRLSDHVPQSARPWAESPARDLSAAGITPGSNIGVIGSGYGQYWAHQAGLRIAVTSERPSDGSLVGPATVERITREACERGVSLSAIVARDGQLAPDLRLTTLRGGLVLWRPEATCAPDASTQLSALTR